MKTQSLTSIALVSLLITVAASNLAVSTANPLRVHEIEVASPQNNYVYSTSDVWLQFTPIKTAWVSNYSSYSYVLDDNALQVTNGNTLLTNVPAGSHKLTICGNMSSGYFANQNIELEVIYFNVNYSSNWVIFGLSFTVFMVVLSLVLFVNRRQLVVRLRAKKNAFFWVGLVTIIFASLFVVPLGYKMLSDYLFPYDTRGAIVINPLPPVIYGLIVICVGILFLVVGTVQIKFPKWTPPKKKQANSKL